MEAYGTTATAARRAASAASEGQQCAQVTAQTDMFGRPATYYGASGSRSSSSCGCATCLGGTLIDRIHWILRSRLRVRCVGSWPIQTHTTIRTVVEPGSSQWHRDVRRDSLTKLGGTLWALDEAGSDSGSNNQDESEDDHLMCVRGRSDHPSEHDDEPGAGAYSLSPKDTLLNIATNWFAHLLTPCSLLWRESNPVAGQCYQHPGSSALITCCNQALA